MKLWAIPVLAFTFKACAPHSSYIHIVYEPAARPADSNNEQVDNALKATRVAEVAGGVNDRFARLACRTIPAGGGTVYCVSFSHDETMLALATSAQSIDIWDTESLRKIFELRSGTTAYAVAFSPCANVLASAGADNAIRIWDLENKTVSWVLQAHERPAFALAFSPDGSMLASGGLDCKVILWDVAAGTQLTAFNEHSDKVTSVAFSPDGKTLASAGLDGTVRLWDVRSLKRSGVLKGHNDSISAIAFSPDGGKIASSSWDKTIRIWDLKSSGQIAVISCRERVCSLEFTLNDSKLVCGGAAGSLEIINTSVPRNSEVLSKHVRAILTARISSKNRWLASGGNDGLVKLYNWDNHKPSDVAHNGARGPWIIHAQDLDTKSLASAESDSDAFVPIAGGLQSRRGTQSATVTDIRFSAVGEPAALSGSFLKSSLSPKERGPTPSLIMSGTDSERAVAGGPEICERCGGPKTSAARVLGADNCVTFRQPVEKTDNDKLILGMVLCLSVILFKVIGRSPGRTP